MTAKIQAQTVYLAYAPDEPAFAAEAKNFLAEAGFVVHGELGGSLDHDLALQVREAIKECDALVILATPSVVHSSRLTLEVGIAMAWAKPTFLVAKNLAEESLPPHLKRLPRFSLADLGKLAGAMRKNGAR